MTTNDPGAGCSLRERTGLSGGPKLVVEALHSQRRRFIDFLAALPSSDWGKPTRCSEWSIHDVARHMIDTAELSRNLLIAGRDWRFGPGEFNPNKSPQRWLEARSRQSPAESLAALAAAVEAEHDSLTGHEISGGVDQLIGPTRRLVHWTVFAAHMFWDAWIHERDVLMPWGLEHRTTAAETRLACLYGLTVAAAPSVRRHQSLRTVICLDGAPDPGYRLSVAPDGIVVETASSTPADLRGEVGAALDSLAGRDGDLDAVLSGCQAHLRYLGDLRRIMRAGLPSDTDRRTAG